MVILALDTSMAACSACLYQPEHQKVIAEKFMPMERGQAEQLAPLVQHVMAKARVDIQTISHVLVTVGPGSFTGLRVGLSYAKGLGLALGCPVSGINSLQALAANVCGANLPAMASDFWVAIEARNGEAYVAPFTARGEQKQAPMLKAQKSLAAELAAHPQPVLGTAAQSLLELAALPLSWQLTGGDLPVAAHFAPSILRPDHLIPALPLYLRQPDIKPQPVQLQALEIAAVGSEASPLLAALHQKSFAKAWNIESFAELLSVPGTQALIISLRAEPQGFILFRALAGEVEILTLTISPPCRRQGLATKLIEAMEERVKKQGYTKILLEVAATNHPAQELYKQTGFKPHGQRKAYYTKPDGTQEDALIFRKG